MSTPMGDFIRNLPGDFLALLRRVAKALADGATDALRAVPKWAIALLPLLGGCEGCGSEPEEAPAPEEAASPLSRYFPSAPGDRWRIRVGTDAHSHGVTATDDRGQAVYFGTHYPQPRRFKVTDLAVTEVTPEGDSVGVELEAPLEEGAVFDYQRGTGDDAVLCQGHVDRVNETRSVGGVRLTDCIEVHHECSYPADHKVIPGPTVQRIDRVHCAGVGIVEEESRFDPPVVIQGQTLQRRQQLVAWRVAGGPVHTPSRFDCDAFLLLPTDVQAACGPAFTLADPAGEAEQGLCRYRYGSPEGEVLVEARATPR